MSTIEKLLATRKILEAQGKVATGCWYDDGPCFCLSGALMRVCGVSLNNTWSTSLGDSAVAPAYAAIESASMALYGTSPERANDAFGLTGALAILDKAIGASA